MRYLTDRKRAAGLGSAKTGVEHHWHMIVSSTLLIVLVPAFVAVLAPIVGGTHDEVVTYLSHPLRALVLALGLIVGLDHFRHGVQVLIEDYVAGGMRKFLIIVMVGVSYGLMAAGVFALARIAL